MSDKVQFACDVKLKVGKSDKFEVGNVVSDQVAKVKVCKAKLDNLDITEFFYKSQNLGTNAKVKNTRHRTKLLIKRDNN